MSEQQIIEKVSEEIVHRSETCERGIIGMRFHGDDPIGGYALVAPDCIMYAQPLVPERDIFIDFCLN